MKTVQSWGVLLMAFSCSVACSMEPGQSPRDKAIARSLIDHGNKIMRAFKEDPCSQGAQQERRMRKEFLQDLAADARDERVRVKPTSVSMARRLKRFEEKARQAARDL